MRVVLQCNELVLLCILASIMTYSRATLVEYELVDIIHITLEYGYSAHSVCYACCMHRITLLVGPAAELGLKKSGLRVTRNLDVRSSWWDFTPQGKKYRN